jgi:hypothetical protein
LHERLVRGALARLGVHNPLLGVVSISGFIALYVLISVAVGVAFLLSPDALCASGGYAADGRDQGLVRCPASVVLNNPPP